MSEYNICTDNRFELIEKYKQKLIQATNIEDSPDEMKVLDNILFRMGQMGWLDRLEKDELVFPEKGVSGIVEKYCTKYCNYTKMYFGRYKDADKAMEHLEKKCENCPLSELL